LEKELLLGVDIGTSSSKGVLIDGDGAVLADALVEHGINIIKPSWVEQDPDACYWGDFKEITKVLLRKTRVSPTKIVGVGVSGLAPDIVPIDKKGAVVRPAIIYMDRRAWKESDELERKIGLEEIVKRTGNTADPYYAGYKLEWFLRNEPDNYNKTWKVLNSDKYVTFKLTGSPVIDHSTAMMFAPYYDPRKGKWFHEMSDLIGVRRRKTT
jgi:xylulokinase